MSEKIPNNNAEQEKSVEIPPNPTEEEVRMVFEDMLGIKEYTTERKIEDENGLHIWMILVKGEDGDTEYDYKNSRPGRVDSHGAETPGIRIYKALYDKDGIPLSGGLVAQVKDGVWEKTEYSKLDERAPKN